MSPSPAAIRKISREITKLESEPLQGIRVVVSDEDILDLQAWIEGPVGTGYEGELVTFLWLQSSGDSGCAIGWASWELGWRGLGGGYFKIRFVFGSEYPNSPPKCFFHTRLFHPNVAPKTGEICVNTLKKDWKKELGIADVLVTIKCLLIYPNPESALDEEAGKMLLENYDDYVRHAKLMTSIHATPKQRPKEFEIPSASSSSSSSSSSSATASTSKIVTQTTTTVTTTTTTTTTLLNNKHDPMQIDSVMTSIPSSTSCSPNPTSSFLTTPPATAAPQPLQTSTASNSMMMMMTDSPIQPIVQDDSSAPLTKKRIVSTPSTSASSPSGSTGMGRSTSSQGSGTNGGGGGGNLQNLNVNVEITPSASVVNGNGTTTEKGVEKQDKVPVGTNASGGGGQTKKVGGGANGASAAKKRGLRRL